MGSARDLEMRMIFYLMFASGTHADITLATAKAYKSIADQWNAWCMLVQNL